MDFPLLHLFYYLATCFFKKLYLFERKSCGGGGSERGIDLQFSGYFPMGQLEARSQELHQGLPPGWQGLSYGPSPAPQVH